MMTESKKILKLFYCYAREDKALRDELDVNLSSLKRHLLITSWYDGEITPGTEWEKEIDTQLRSAHLILLLVTPHFIASDYLYGVEMQRALKRHQDGTARVIPIILRRTFWEGTPFSSLQVLPEDAKPVNQWADRDEAFWNITVGINKAVKDLQSLAIPMDESVGSTLVESSRHSKNSYQLYEVFVKSGIPKITFVVPQDFIKLKLALAQPGRGIVIEGPSGAGKTTAIEKAVEELSKESSFSAKNIPIQRLSARKPEHRSKLETLRQWHQGVVIVDDFHRLGSELCRDLIDYLKYLADTEPVSKKLVIVGIPRTGQTLVDTSFDLATRIDVLKFGHVKEDLIQRVVEQGSEALNITFYYKKEIILAAKGSLNIAQFICFQLCLLEQITTTKVTLHLVQQDISLAIDEVINDLGRKFGESIRHFAALGGPLDLTTLIILEEFVLSGDGFISLPLLKHNKPELANGIERLINEQWIEKLYKEYPPCKQHLFFDQDMKILAIDDPQLLFYLQRLRFSTLSKTVGKIATEDQRKVFICYSHKNTQELARLQVHLAPLEREGAIDLWDDTKIAAGVLWKDAIFTALKTAKVAIILVSADFLASDFIAEHELPTLLKQVAAGGTTIIPVIISPSLFSKTKLGTFQSINPPDQPLSVLSTSDQEQIWVKVTEAVMKRFTLDK